MGQETRGRMARAAPHLEVGKLQILVGLPMLEFLEQVAAGLGLAESRQPLLAAPQALGPPQHSGQEAQLGQLSAGSGGGGSGGGLPGGAAVAVTERLAVPQQSVEPHADLQVIDALDPVLGAVLVQAVAVCGLEGHELVPREAAEAVALVLRPRGSQHRRQHQPHAAHHVPAAKTRQHRGRGRAQIAGRAESVRFRPGKGCGPGGESRSLETSGTGWARRLKGSIERSLGEALWQAPLFSLHWPSTFGQTQGCLGLFGAPCGTAKQDSSVSSVKLEQSLLLVQLKSVMRWERRTSRSVFS